MRKPRLAKGEEKRQDILDAAGRVFLRDGLRGASISGICKEAGISPGHLYHYFDSKEAILEEIARICLAGIEGDFSITGSEGVIETITNGIKRAPDQPIAIRALVFEVVTEASRNPGVAAILHENAAWMQEFFAGLIRKGQERGEVSARLSPDITATVLIDLIDAAKITHLRDPRADVPAATEMLAAMAERLLTDGL